MEVIGNANMASAMSNGDHANGFVDPRVLLQLDEQMDGLDSSDPKVTETEISDVTSSVAPRRYYLPTGCCYDDRMKLHANADFSQNPSHPEDPQRIEAIMTEFRDGGLIYSGPDSELMDILQDSPHQWMYRIAAREATKPEICMVHLPTHFHWVEALSKMSSADLRLLSKQMDMGRKSLYVGNLTYEAALLSAGGAIETCKNVVAGNVKNAIAIIRPPGHHAEYDQAMGFCLFNNVPIATRVCQADYPETCRKVLILDWDVHHGNGVQNIFYDDPNVLYISIHVFDDGEFYPGRPDVEGVPDGDIDKCGSGPGIGHNINIGWATQGMGDGEYMAAFQKIVMPIAQEFDPDLVVVSAGFDAAAGDELGGCFVSPECYAHMTHMLMSLANGKVAVCLEGGYNLKAISRSALAVAKTLMGEPPSRMLIPAINYKTAKLLQRVKEMQAPYWRCMRVDVADVRDAPNIGGVRLSNMIRAYQRQALSERHKMIPLYIQRPNISETFRDQVLATQGLYETKKIFLIIHDPPDVPALTDPVDNHLEPHNAWVTDGVAKYVDWAIADGFGVLDVNMPMNYGAPATTTKFTDRPAEADLQLQLKELVCYLWDNYLESYDANHIVIMGVGDSYLGVKQLLMNRDVKSKIRAVLNFVSGSLRPVKSETDPYLSSWYKEHSCVYVTNHHACWYDEEILRKVRKKRFGNVIRSPETNTVRMMEVHREEAVAWLKQSVGEDSPIEDGIDGDTEAL